MSTTIRHILDHINHDELVGEPGGTPVGPWQDFVVDPGWTSTMRYRTLAGGLQFEGVAMGSISGGALARIGALPPAYRPARQQVMMGAVIAGISYAYGFLVFQTNGDVITWWSAAGTQIIVAGIVSLD